MRKLKNRAVLAAMLWLALVVGAAEAGAQTSTIPADTIPGAPPLPVQIVRPAPGARMPVVVMLHGGSGLDRDQSAALQKWAAWLSERGVASVIVDSYGGRGLSRFSSRTDLLSFVRMLRERADDVVRTVAWLAGEPWADTGRIALLGQSQGASAASIAALERGVRLPQILFYPGCDVRYFDVAPLPDAYPASLWLLAERDTLTPPATCTAVIERLGDAARDARVVTLPGATHVFDWQAPERTDPRGNVYRHDAPAERAAQSAVADFLETQGFLRQAAEPAGSRPQ